MESQIWRVQQESCKNIGDYNSTYINYHPLSAYDFGEDDLPQEFSHDLLPEYSQYTYPAYLNTESASELACPKFVGESSSTSKHPVFAIKWMQHGRKLITGHTNGEIHVWNGVTLNFDTVNSLHEDGIKVMKWAKDHEWLITADKKG